MSFAMNQILSLSKVNLNAASLTQSSRVGFAGLTSFFSLPMLAGLFKGTQLLTSSLKGFGSLDGQEGDQVTFSAFSLNFDTQEGDQ